MNAGAQGSLRVYLKWEFLSTEGPLQDKTTKDFQIPFYFMKPKIFA